METSPAGTRQDVAHDGTICIIGSLECLYRHVKQTRVAMTIEIRPPHSLSSNTAGQRLGARRGAAIGPAATTTASAAANITNATLGPCAASDTTPAIVSGRRVDSRLTSWKLTLFVHYCR